MSKCITTEFKPPMYATQENGVFLAGSIEMGKAEDWQKRVTEKLSKSNCILSIYNPRRDDWDSSWKQEKNNPQFYEQVTWELDHLEKAKVIAMYFATDTLSPISLLELGLYASSGKVVVYCPTDFWRNGNVDITCSRYGVPIFTNEDAWLVEINSRLRK